MKNTSALSAFTLIEMLFVTSVTGILAGLLFPAFHGAQTQAAAVSIGNNGRNIVLSIIATNIEREALSMGEIWPTEDACFKDWQKADEPSGYTQGVSETYFADLMEYYIVEGISPVIFAGAGIPAAANTDEFRAGGRNAWSYIGGCPSDIPYDMPFLITQNFRITNDDLRCVSDDKIKPPALADRLDASKLPFGDTKVVTVSRGAEMIIVKAAQLDPRVFYGAPLASPSPDLKDITVVHAK